MLNRASQLFLPTLREAPADAEARSHKLLVRGGYIRQMSAGLWTYLPLGWKAHQNVVQVVREEMDAIGCQEMLAPVLTPAELWQATGRYEIPELFKLSDRNGREYILPLTHEESFTFHARELQSYRQLPQMLYHFQEKDRDEPRPRGGLLRVREFIMKDAYSFDVDEEGLDRSFELQRGAYHRIFERCGLEFFEVQAESGMMGGSDSRDFLAPSSSGENTLVLCDNGDYAADLEIARGVPRQVEFPAGLDAPEEIATPGVTTIESLAELLGIDPAATSKAMPVTTEDGTVVLALVRGDDRLSEEKLHHAVPGARASTEAEIRAAFGADPGSLGPVGFDGEVVADEALREGQFVAGANRTGFHLRGVEHGRDFEARFADLREAAEGDSCPSCGGSLSFRTAIEVGHIFKLGTYYSVPLEASVLDEAGTARPIVMGSYGIGPGRVMAAAVEQGADDETVLWPREVAPYEVEVISLDAGSAEIAAVAEQVANALHEQGKSVLLDDRDQRPGEKFADADLFGAPVRVVVGRKTLDDGAVDVRDRRTGDEERVGSLDAANWVVAR
ncbi:MAG TPA: proline--tRNA ligase [Gaiellaceae bacterium]|jgi:prolyl-tRNA synthetase